jgi:hypothetical protein
VFLAKFWTVWRGSSGKNERLFHKPPSCCIEDPSCKLEYRVPIPNTNASQGYHVQVTARSDRDLTPESIVQKVADASGSKYSSGASHQPSGATPPVAAKPAFMPTRSVAGSAYNPLASSASRKIGHDVDEDGWGADAPPVTRSQLEKVQSAYKPTKVNMAELTKQTQEPSRFNGASRQETESPDVVRGTYQPIGKVDIAAIRAQAKEAKDDRPTIVKGAYEPVGKVDIAAIRAKAQKPNEPSQPSPPPFQKPSSSGENDQPKSLADRSAAFTQSERLTTLPKPKIAKKFGSNTNSFTGTKPLSPGVFGLHSASPAITPAPVGAASRTFADEGGKTPAQIWAEKKARQRGLSGAADTISPGPASPMAAQTSGGGEWKSGYTGKSWAPVAVHSTGRSATGSIGQQRTGEQDHAHDEEDAPSSPAGGIGAIRDRFKGAAPMGAPLAGSAPIARATTGDSEEAPPPLPSSTRPTGGVAMSSLPARPRPAEDEDEEERGRPDIPTPPRIQRSPTPEEREESPVRIAIPVSRGQPTHIEAAEEQPPLMPVRSMQQSIPDESELTEEPTSHVAQSIPHPDSHGGGKRAVVQYDYEKAEDNEIELVEGDYVTNIEMVDEDWWMGTNSKGDSGLFPSNYVELVEDDAHEEPPAPTQPARPTAPEPTPAPASSTSGPTANALYDYEAAEDNELSFAEGDKITGLVSKIEDVRFISQLISHRNSRTRTGGLVTMVESLVFSLPTMSSLMNK